MRPVLLILLVALSACGFQPRGKLAVAEALGPVQVETADPYSPLAYGLATALERAGVAPAVEGSKSATLKVLSEQLVTRPLVVDQVAQVREFVTVYQVDFQLNDAAGKALVKRQSVELSREFTYNPFASAGSPAEQEIIERELRRDMQAAILRRLDIALRPAR